MTSQGFPTVNIYQNYDLRRILMVDFLYHAGNDHSTRSVINIYHELYNFFFRIAKNELLKDLSDRLEDNGKKLSDYDLPEPENAETEVQCARI